MKADMSRIALNYERTITLTASDISRWRFVVPSLGHAAEPTRKTSTFTWMFTLIQSIYSPSKIDTVPFTNQGVIISIRIHNQLREAHSALAIPRLKVFQDCLTWGTCPRKLLESSSPLAIEATDFFLGENYVRLSFHVFPCVMVYLLKRASFPLLHIIIKWSSIKQYPIKTDGVNFELKVRQTDHTCIVTKCETLIDTEQEQNPSKNLTVSIVHLWSKIWFDEKVWQS